MGEMSRRRFLLFVRDATAATVAAAGLPGVARAVVTAPPPLELLPPPPPVYVPAPAPAPAFTPWSPLEWDLSLTRDLVPVRRRVAPMATQVPAIYRATVITVIDPDDPYLVDVHAAHEALAPLTLRLDHPRHNCLYTVTAIPRWVEADSDCYAVTWEGTERPLVELR